MATIVEIGLLIFVIVLLIVFITLPLNLAARMLYEDDELIKAFGTTVLIVLTYVGCIYIIQWDLVAILIAFLISLVLIKEIYDTTWASAVVMWIVAIIMAIVITVIAAIFIGVTLIFLG